MRMTKKINTIYRLYKSAIMDKYWKCDNCGYILCLYATNYNKQLYPLKDNFNYCPGCGGEIIAMNNSLI